MTSPPQWAMASQKKDGRQIEECSLFLYTIVAECQFSIQTCRSDIRRRGAIVRGGLSPVFENGLSKIKDWKGFIKTYAQLSVEGISS